jgi:[acyl-carrier-protein] S-malonyltransferase
MGIAFTFPGQGSQVVGMGRDLADAFPVARAVFDAVDDALDERLSRIIWDGPADRLTLTENAQPALMAVSCAVMRVLETEKGVKPAMARFVAGHSLGEYSALAAAGALSLADTARLLRLRGKAMQEAVPVGEGAMAALLGVDVESAAKIAAEAASVTGLVCGVANDNAPGQVVISGAKAAIEKAMELGKDYGVRRAIPLPVSAPFHCALMQPAAIRLALVEQVTGAVRWRESAVYMAEQGVRVLYEIGAGRVLTGMAKRIDDRLEGRAIGTVADIETAGAQIAAAV